MSARKKVLVCGATGFIGRNIAESLLTRKDIELYGTYFKSTPWNEAGITWLKADLTKQQDVEQITIGMDVIIQAAATTSGSKDIVTRPYIHVTDNAVMNSLLFRSAFEHNIPQVIFFSCSVMYQPSNTLVKESDFDANLEMFKSYFGVGWTKVYIEKLCEFYSRLGRTKYTVLRHSNIYGPHDKFDLERSHVFGATMTKVMTAKDKIVVWGTGEEERDLLYVSDLARAVSCALERQSEPFTLVNIGLGRSIAIKDLVQKIITCSGKKLAIEFDNSKPTIKTKLALDCNKALAILGWQPITSLNEGIQKTMDWYRENIIT